MKQYLHQVVFCSDRVGRAYRREITVTDRHAMVTNVETLPPHYEIPLERMREENEEVSMVAVELEYWNGYQGCPFCGNRTIFICGCGYLSCRGSDARPVHTCPKCRRTMDTKKADATPMSKSGLVHGKGELPGRREPPSVGGPERLLREPYDGEKEAHRSQLRKFLADQRKMQIEDKRDKK